MRALGVLAVLLAIAPTGTTLGMLAAEGSAVCARRCGACHAVYLR